METAIAIGSTLLVLGSRLLLKKIKQLSDKRKLKKILYKAFKDIDMEMMKDAILGLLDYDAKHKSKKTDKYLIKIVRDFKDLNINESNLLESKNNLTMLKNIFDEDEERLKADDDLIDARLDEITKKRKEIILRKNQLKTNNILIANRKNRRTTGKLG